jgi:DnaJ-class molecular chaperone
VLCNIGIDSGDKIHVPEAGHSGGLGAQPGSLYIKIKVSTPTHA